MLCPKCHSLLTKGAKYCDICGTRISQEDIQVEEVGSRVKNREKHKKEVRKNTKIIILGIIALVVVIAMLGFILFFKGNKPSYSPDNLVSQHVEKPLHLEKSKVTLNIGDEYTIQTNLKCTYQSKNEKICIVDTNGKITALSSGKTKVICTSESLRSRAALPWRPKPATSLSPRSVDASSRWRPPSDSASSIVAPTPCN